MSPIDTPSLVRWATGEASFRAGALPVLSWGLTVIESAEGGDSPTPSGRLAPGHDEIHPAVEVDVRDRPDVADLPRVHAMEGPGRIHASARLFRRRSALTSWGRSRRRGAGPRLVRIDTVVSSPVNCTFAVVLDLARHRHVLRHIASSHSLVLATTSGPDLTGARWLSLSLDGDAIGQLLHTADTGYPAG
jgi:hypothetical protein